MSIRNKKAVVIFPLLLALVLVLGMFIGLKLNKSGISERLLIMPRGDKVNNVLNLIEDSYVDSVSRNKLEEVAIQSVLKELDPHSVYIPADELQAVNEPLEGNFSGVGIQFNSQSDTIIVVNTVSNGPSERVGIKPGDRLIRINDTIVAGVKLATNDIVKKLKGTKGSKVKITVKRPGLKDSIDFHVTTSSGTDRLGNIDIYFGAGAGTFLGGTGFFRGRTDEKGELSVEWVAPAVQANSTYGINIEAFEIGYRAAREPIAGQDCWFDIEVVVKP